VTARPLVPLPVQVRPRHGETANSYVRRMARANHLSPSYLRSVTCDNPNLAVRADRLATLSGRTAEALEHTLAGLSRRPGADSQFAGIPVLPGREAPIFDTIRRNAAEDATTPVRRLAARHRVSHRTVLQALTPPGSRQGAPNPRWRMPVLAPVRPLIDTWLAEEPGLPAQKIWERLLDEHDAEISYLTVKTYVTRRRAKPDDTTRPWAGPDPVRDRPRWA
jgi:hypothetical protein